MAAGGSREGQCSAVGEALSGARGNAGAGRPPATGYSFWGRFRYDPINNGAWMHTWQDGQHTTWFYRFSNSGSPPPSDVGPDITFTASPMAIAPNGQTVLTWTSDADSCTASGDWSGSKDVSGSETISALTSDSNFILSCSDANGSVSDSVDVTIILSGNGTALLSWTPPTENTDGSTLTDLAGYKIYYGTASSSYTEIVTINNPGLSSYQIDNLTTADWYFVVTSVNSAGIESSYSTEVSKTIN